MPALSMVSYHIHDCCDFIRIRSDLLTMCPKNFTCSRLNTHLSETPASAIFVRLWPNEYHADDPKLAHRPFDRILSILRWNNSGVLEIPNGSLLKQY